MADNQIHLKGGFRHEEAEAAGTITPGMLCEWTSAGAVQAHSTEGGRAERLVAVEDALQGNETSDNYSSGDNGVQLHLLEPGAVTQAWLAAGENVAIGDELISEGTGMLIADGSESSGVTVAARLAVAMEAKDLSASSAVDTLIDVRWY